MYQVDLLINFHLIIFTNTENRVNVYLIIEYLAFNSW